MRERCPACGCMSEIVHVHGHGQCARCGTNVEPCCDGGPSDDGRRDEAREPPADPQVPGTDRR